MSSFSSIEDLAVRDLTLAHANTFSSPSIVTIPGLEILTLSEADRRALWARIMGLGLQYAETAGLCHASKKFLNHKVSVFAFS